MYIKQLTKDSIFVKKIGNAYLVDENEIDGIKTIRTTSNPLKAHQFTLQNVYQLVYNSLDSDEERAVMDAHKTKDPYGILSRKINNDYRVLVAERLDYGYPEDVESEAKLLISMGMDYVFTPTKIITESIDTIEENKEA